MGRHLYRILLLTSLINSSRLLIAAAENCKLAVLQLVSTESMCLIQRNVLLSLQCISLNKFALKHDDCVDKMQINRWQSTAFCAFCCIVSYFFVGVVDDNKTLYNF